MLRVSKEKLFVGGFFDYIFVVIKANVSNLVDEVYMGAFMRVYIAAPLFNIAEKKQNEEIDCIFTLYGHKTYLPQRDGGCFSDLPDFIGDRPKGTILFEKDIEALDWCDTLLFVFDGRVPDEGACFELGYAFAKGKYCIGYKTDTRSLIDGSDNLMLSEPLEIILHSEDELREFVQNHTNM